MHDATKDDPKAADPAALDAEASDPRAGGPLEDKVVAALKTVYDPEIPVDIYELGLIYDIQVDDEANVEIRMTLTSPACPVAGSLPGDVQSRVASIPEIGSVEVELVWDPAWNPGMMSEAARLELGMF